VAAYEGKPQEKSKKAFGSLLIIMGTTVVTMLIVGPAIFAVSEPNNENVSVFTQTMDALLPSPLPYLGTMIGIAVLLSASAAAAQGLQNLALGLKDRHYIPAFLGERNKFDVADKPVWLQVGLVIVIFLLVGTNEETYLALYAAGVFILLSMTGWAAAKRLLRELRQNFILSHSAVLVGTASAAAITTAATIVIFQERFVEGAWMYFVFIPLLYTGFTYSRTRLGTPSPAAERLGELEGAMWGGFGFGQSFESQPKTALQPLQVVANQRAGALEAQSATPRWQEQIFAPEFMLVPLDGSEFAEQALPAAEVLSRAFHAHISLVSVFDKGGRLATIPFSKSQDKESNSTSEAGEVYLMRVTERLRQKGIYVDYTILEGPVAETIINYAEKHDVDMIIISTHGRSGMPRWILGSVANRMIQLTTKPILIIRPIEGEAPPIPQFDCLLVTLDGSRNAERVLPYVRASTRFDSRVILLSVPEIPDEYRYGAVVEEIAQLRKQAVAEAEEYLQSVACVLREDGISVDIRVEGSRPAKTIVRVAQEENVDVVMLATHGHGGLDRLFMGSVADRVVQNTRSPVFIVPAGSRSPEKN
jgi:nucleotide-binding universal stress UspA family protein